MKKRPFAPFAVAVILAAFAAAAGSASPADKPDFSGTYVLDMERTVLQEPWRIEAGEIVLTHRGAEFRFERVFRVKDQTEPSTASFSGMIDGPETVVTEGKETTRFRLYWDGNVLVADWTITTPRGPVTNVVRYSLTEAGKTLTGEESFRGPRLKYDNVWVAKRK